MADDLYWLLQVMEKQEYAPHPIDKNDTMKLFLCKKCQDIVRCFKKERSCKCGKSKGYYIDNVNAVFTGKHCVPLGFANNKLGKAIEMAEIENKHQVEPTTCKGVDFLAFVILDCSTSVKKEK